MARSHAKILCTVWQDPAWCSLSFGEQWAFEMLLSQPKLSLVGCLDLMQARWARYCRDAPAPVIDALLGGLERAGYVCLDPDTGEVLVRTFTIHDGIPISNERLRKGLWGAYGQVASARLRKVAVDNMPDEFFDFPHPTEAECFRRSERIEWALERAFVDPSEQATDSPEALDLPPLTSLLTPDSNGRSNARPDFQHHPVPKLDPQQQATNLDAVRAMRERKDPA